MPSAVETTSKFIAARACPSSAGGTFLLRLSRPAQHHAAALRAFLFDLGDHHAADLCRVGHVRAATGLQVDQVARANAYRAHRAAAARRLHAHAFDQLWIGVELGIGHAVGSLASRPERDLLIKDFTQLETVPFINAGTSYTPAHHYSDFRFKIYAPLAFRYFRDLFGIKPDDFLLSLCNEPLVELSNPGASGSVFYLSNDDNFIIKTVQLKEAEFLLKLLPGYYLVRHFKLSVL